MSTTSPGNGLKFLDERLPVPITLSVDFGADKRLKIDHLRPVRVTFPGRCKWSRRGTRKRRMWKAPTAFEFGEMHLVEGW